MANLNKLIMHANPSCIFLRGNYLWKFLFSFIDQSEVLHFLIEYFMLNPLKKIVRRLQI